MNIKAVYFSPTHGTRRIIETLIQTLKTGLELDFTELDITLPPARNDVPAFAKNDCLVLGLPVYGGRIPLLVDAYVNALKGNGTTAIIVAVYGNRAYEDALLEMRDILRTNGFTVIAAAAFIGEHSLSRRVAAGRPDGDDIALVREFAAKAAGKLTAYTAHPDGESIDVSGNYPYRDRNSRVTLAPFTTDACYRCMLCAQNCPTEAISFDDPHIADGAKCIRCCACVKFCPAEAKLFNAESIQQRVAGLEDKFMKRQVPEMFL